jgi:pimeloyl-ACP methyl ester carboxylesterase
LIVAEGLLFKNYPENARDFSGTADEIRARILNRRNDLIAQVLIQGMVDVSEDHAQANYYYWETMAGSDFRDVLPKIDVPTLIMYADPGSGYYPAIAEYMQTQIPDAVMMPIYGCTHMAAAESPNQWRGTIIKFAY